MARPSAILLVQPDDGRFWTDGWNGYPAARKRLFDDLQRHRPANLVVVSGDVHAFYAADLKPDFARKTSADNPLSRQGFAAPRSRQTRPQSRTEHCVADNPHLRYGRSERRGFALVELSPEKMRVDFMGLDNVFDADSAATVLARFTVEDGKAGVQAS